MRRRIMAAALVLGWLVPAAAGAADRTAEKILAEIEAIELPQVDAMDREIPDLRKMPPARQQQAMARKAKLIDELRKAHPDRPELDRLVPIRWRLGLWNRAKAAADVAEVDAILAKGDGEKLFAEAAYYKVLADLGRLGPAPKLDKVMPTIEEFLKRAPKDPRGGLLLASAAPLQKDPARRKEILARVEKDYPDGASGRAAGGDPAQPGEVGKPFNLAFVDAIRGSKVSIKGLKGKVVVVDFWATWCGPCKEEMPKMKALYAQYKKQGVEFIGVSLDSPADQGGLDSLREYVGENGIAWPQFYQGAGWDSAFSKAWGINSIPAAFLVDADGNLATIKARGNLDRLIPEYLEKAKAAPAKK